MDNKILFCFLLSLNLINVGNIDAMQDLSESTIKPEFRTVTFQAMLTYRTIKNICQCWGKKLDINPNFGRTKEGLVFTFIDERCVRLHTPWGVIESYSSFFVLKRLLDIFCTTEIVENEKCEGEGIA